MKKTIFDLIMEIGNDRPVGIDGIAEIGNISESEVQAVVAEMVADGTLKYSEYEENCVYIVADLKDEKPKKVQLTKVQKEIIDIVAEMAAVKDVCILDVYKSRGADVYNGKMSSVDRSLKALENKGMIEISKPYVRLTLAGQAVADKRLATKTKEVKKDKPFTKAQKEVIAAIETVIAEGNPVTHSTIHEAKMIARDANYDSRACTQHSAAATEKVVSNLIEMGVLTVVGETWNGEVLYNTELRYNGAGAEPTPATVIDDNKSIALTKKQQAVVNKVQEANDLGMTLEDTIVYQAEWAGISSTSGVRRIINKLVELGVIERYLTTEWASKLSIADKVNIKVSKPLQDCDSAEELLKQLSDNDISTRALKVKTHHHSTPSYYKVRDLERILGPAKFNIFKVALHRRKYISLYNCANHNTSTTIPGGYLVVSGKGHESVGNKVPK